MIRKVLPLVALTLLSSTLFAGTFQTNRPSSTDNDDSCDISVLPAATLLLPYFEVEVNAPASVAKTTIFTVVNTTRNPQIARITLWTDYGYPVMTFNAFLTGYDVQAFNVYDLIVRGIIAPPSGTSNANTPGSRSLSNTGGNLNFLPDAAQTCNSSGVPSILPANITQDIRNALTIGTSTACGSTRIGGIHDLPGGNVAAGFITIDLVANCSYVRPTDAAFFKELLYDNVLTGDYEQIAPNPATGNYAGGNPLVHIRAIPEGGPAGNVASTGLPYTFYDHLTPGTARQMDRRQPLPATFVARYIQGGPTAFTTEYQIWREPLTAANAACDLYRNNIRPYVEAVRFDERENPTTVSPSVIPEAPFIALTLPVASKSLSTNVQFPPLTSGDLAGWMYLNLHTGGSGIPGTRPSQNWVTVNMFAEGRFSVMFDATMLGNGCSPVAPSPTGTTTNPIGPAPNN